MPKCKVMTKTNQKGRIGKTPTTLNLELTLLKLGKKVLLIVADIQAI